MNGIGLMGLALLQVGITLFTVGIIITNTIFIFASLPFSVVGVLCLADDLLLKEKITKKILGWI